MRIAEAAFEIARAAEARATEVEQVDLELADPLLGRMVALVYFQGDSEPLVSSIDAGAPVSKDFDRTALAHALMAALSPSSARH